MTDERQQTVTQATNTTRDEARHAAHSSESGDSPVSRCARSPRTAQIVALIGVVFCVSLIGALGSRAASARVAVVAANSDTNDTNAMLDPSSDPSLDPSAQQQQPTGDFSKFSHAIAQHSRLPCLLCHRRENNAIVPVRSLGHSPCIGCHQQQFSNQQSNICTICHTQIGSSKPPLKPFPSLKTFTLHFDHATHARNAANCATCHKPAGRASVALSIPVSFNAHATCFQCHTPHAQAAGRDISSCDTCHQLGGFARTSAWSRAYTSTPFNHAAHTRKGLSCADCHTLRAGAPLARQVSAPTPSQHHAPAGTRSCASCHDNKRAFGGNDFNDCTRCHRGNAWHF